MINFDDINDYLSIMKNTRSPARNYLDKITKIVFEGGVLNVGDYKFKGYHDTPGLVKFKRNRIF